MQKMRESWTDAKLDEFRAETERRFDKIDARFDTADQRFDGVEKRLERVEHELSALGTRVDGLNRTLMQTGGGIIATLIASSAALVATQI